MTALAATTATFALAVLLAGQVGTASLPIYVPVTGFFLAGIIYAARSISPYLRIFIVMYAVGYLLLAGFSLLAALGALPALVAELLPPPFAASAAAVFAAIVYAASHIPVIRTITKIADPFFEAKTPATTFGRLFAWMGPTEGSVGSRPCRLADRDQLLPGRAADPAEPLVPRPVQRAPGEERRRLLVPDLRHLRPARLRLDLGRGLRDLRGQLAPHPLAQLADAQDRLAAGWRTERITASPSRASRPTTPISASRPISGPSSTRR
jgi:putative ATP-binding cassette transporter